MIVIGKPAVIVHQRRINRLSDISWDDNDTPIANRFGDCYYSRNDGRGETQHVFLAGNDLPARWRLSVRFTIAELGFGTALNFLETVRCWRALMTDDAARLSYVSFERYPLTAAEMTRALAQWSELAAMADPLLAAWPPAEGRNKFDMGAVNLVLFVGDANICLPEWDGLADAWFLDGFSPAKNPDLWGRDLMDQVAAHTKPGGTFATYTAAGWVKRNLQNAGFEVDKMPGFGPKRDCLKGRIAVRRDSTPPANS